jgi:hypothetical protein
VLLRNVIYLHVHTALQPRLRNLCHPNTGHMSGGIERLPQEADRRQSGIGSEVSATHCSNGTSTLSGRLSLHCGGR